MRLWLEQLYALQFAKFRMINILINILWVDYSGKRGGYGAVPRVSHVDV